LPTRGSWPGSATTASVGVQSLSDAELTRIGRPHTATDARAVIRSARRAGFANINIDLMYGLPAQQVRDWRKTLRAALELSPEHLALYELTIEEGTPFAGLLKQGKLELPPEDAVLEMMEVIAAEIHRAGYHRYEISSYSLPGRECRHNINYWHNGSYIGLGAGAVSCVAGRRYAAVRDVELAAMALGVAGKQNGFLQEHQLGPRLNFATAWSSNLVSICRAVGLDAISRVERSRRYLVPEGAEAIEAFIARQHDRMTECVYAAPLTTFETGIVPEPVYEVDLMTKGPDGLLDIPGISMDQWDRELYHRYFVERLPSQPDHCRDHGSQQCQLRALPPRLFPG
jgi:hypothetical protein